MLLMSCIVGTESWFFHSLLEKMNRYYTIAGLRNLLQPCSRAERKWRENEEMKRKWRENEEIERKLRENDETDRD